MRDISREPENRITSGAGPISLLDIIRANIERRLAELRISQRAASMRTGDPGLLRNVTRADRRLDPQLSTLERIAEALEVSVAALLAQPGEMAGAGLPAPAGAPVPVLGTALGSIVGGVQGVRLGAVVQRVPRPPNPSLAEADIYAVFVEGDSMLPDHPDGALRFAMRGRKAREGETVIATVIDRDLADFGQSYIKRYAGLDRAGRIQLRQLNPVATIRYPVRQIRLDRVIPFNELFGI